MTKSDLGDLELEKVTSWSPCAVLCRHFSKSNCSITIWFSMKTFKHLFLKNKFFVSQFWNALQSVFFDESTWNLQSNARSTCIHLFIYSILKGASNCIVYVDHQAWRWKSDQVEDIFVLLRYGMALSVAEDWFLRKDGRLEGMYWRSSVKGGQTNEKVIRE